ncbi:hypothetical protein HanIR_Chr15g0729841 [Helianthus annuus]|nr:hypothetical protein HanIR_Chr15g0729841 [Helianthus annuus]
MLGLILITGHDLMVYGSKVRVRFGSKLQQKISILYTFYYRRVGQCVTV